MDGNFQGLPESNALIEWMEGARLATRIDPAWALSEPWAARFPPDGWGRFYAVTEGTCWISLDGEEAIELGAGDLAVLTRGVGHCLSDAQGRPPRPPAQPLDHPENNPRIAVRSAAFRYHRDAPLAGFPSMIHLRGPLDWLEPALRLIEVESRSNGPGRDHVLIRLVQVILLCAVRAYLKAHSDSPSAVLRSLTDPEIGRALALLHCRPEAPWTVAELAEKVGLSRSAFSARFAAVVGEPPLQYLFHCRMGRACDLLREGRARTKEIAALTGYDSQAAFSRAFKRWTGMPPAAYRGLPDSDSASPDADDVTENQDART